MEQQVITTIQVSPMLPGDWAAVRDIYAEGIAGGDATFAIEVPSQAAWDAQHLRRHRLVARDRGEVVGWAALVPVSDRCAYAGVVENSIYVAARARGRGAGRRLLQALIAECDGDDIWTIQSGVFPENTASLRLHEGCGFRRVGVRERLGQHHGCWRDVIMLERRRAGD